MKEWGYGEGYQHAHKFEDAIMDMECLPPSLAGRPLLLPDRPRLEKRIGGEDGRDPAKPGSGSEPGRQPPAHFLPSFKLITASRRESKELKILVPLVAPWKSAFNS